MAIQWGDLSGEVSAGAAVFALTFAFAAAVSTRRVLRIESERDRVNSEAHRRQGAALVSAWWGRNPDDNRKWGAFVRNASGAPIYQAYVTAIDSDNNIDGAKVRPWLVPPNDIAQFYPIELPGNPPEADIQNLRVRVSFTDAMGVRWIRNEYGQLTETRPRLRVKADAQRAATIATFKDDIKAAYGVAVEFNPMQRDYPQRRFVAELEASPHDIDAVMVAHDWIGDLVRRELIEPVLLSADQQGVIPEWARAALVFNNRQYGIPVTADAVALIRNLSLAPDEPATFEELISTGESLRDSGWVTNVLAARVPEGGDPFQIWPLFTSAGGWLFGRGSDGGWEVNTIGTDSPGSIAAFERLHELGEAGARILRTPLTRQQAFDLFTNQQTPYLLTTTDGLDHALRAGIPIGVSPVPPFADGAPATGFACVHGIMSITGGVNSAMVQDLFTDYLTRQRVMATMSATAHSAIAISTVTIADPPIAVFQKLCETSPPMPAFPQMEPTWRALGRAQAQVIAGADAEATARALTARLKAILGSDNN